jgi:predicted dehydrogenase
MFAAAGAVAVGSAGTVLAADDKQSKSPNERLNVAVVGVKGRGGSHIGAFAGRKDTVITHICDADSDIGQSRVKEVAKRQGDVEPKFVEDIRAVCDDPSVDIVTIATPNHWHALGAIWAIQAGKDVYVEKPVSHNVSEGRRIVEAARKYNKICQTGTQSRSNPGMIEAIKYVQDGELGKCTLARGLCYKPRGSIGARGKYEPPKSVDYNLWTGPAQMQTLTRPKLHYDWHWQWPYGNGDLGNQGIHQMDLARWGLNKSGLSKGVISYGGRFGYEDAGDTANTQVVVHDYDDKSLVFEVRGLKTDSYKGSKIGVIFDCEGGYVVMASYHSGAAFDNDGKKIKDFSGGGNHFSNFLDAVRSRDYNDLNADIEEGHYSSALCHMGNISYRLGGEMKTPAAMERMAEVGTTDNAKATFQRTLDHLSNNGVNPENIQVGLDLAFDPKSETFDDNADANTMLTREYRKPFVVPAAGEV